jgi:hypothetical protein
MSAQGPSKFFDYQNYVSQKLQFKMPNSKTTNLIASERYLFIPIRYRNAEIYIRTPKIVVPFGLNIYTDDASNTKQYYYVLSFTDSDIDPSIDRYRQFLERFEKDCQTRVQSDLKKWCQSQYPDHAPYEFERLNFKSGLKDNETAPLFRFKITTTGRQQTEVYDETGTLQTPKDYEDLITSQCQVISLVEPSNIWINSTEYGITWRVHQVKVYPSNKLTGGISLLDETITVHGIRVVEHIHDVTRGNANDVPSAPPMAPPMAPPAPPMEMRSRIPLGGVSMFGCLSAISGGGFQLKKVDPNDPNFAKKKIKGDFPEISLSEILSIRNRLKKPKEEPSEVIDDGAGIIEEITSEEITSEETPLSND